MATTKTNWQQAAETALQEGYRPGNAWERMLDRHVQRFLPELRAELAQDYQAYLQVTTHGAKELYHRLLDEGSDPMAARELAMAQLLPVPEDERHLAT